MSDDNKLVCGGCGSLNAPHRKTCELCERSLAKASSTAKAQAPNNPVILGAVAIIGTAMMYFILGGIIYFVVLVQLADLGTELGPELFAIPYTLYWVVGFIIANKIDMGGDRPQYEYREFRPSLRFEYEFWRAMLGFALMPVILARGFWDTFLASLRDLDD